MRREITCLKCGVKQTTTSKLTKFCSTTCANTYRYEQTIKEKRLYKRSCKECGSNFETRRLNQVFCSKECYKTWGLKEYESKSHLTLRWKVLVRDKFTCQYCGRTPQQGVILHVDHIIPRSKGGQDVKENFVTACEDCNIGKTNAEYYGEICTYLKNKDFTISSF